MTSNDPTEVLEQSESGVGMCRLHATVCDLGASQGELITVGGQTEVVADQDFRKQEAQFTGHLLANLADPLDQAMALGQAQRKAQGLAQAKAWGLALAWPKADSSKGPVMPWDP